MGQALYRKYRSKSLDEIIGQEHITETLSRAVKSGKISHAYLFTGPRGVGKTSIARILAHEINGLPYSPEDNHIDIIEIDAASNRGIDEIRDLREKVYMAPVAAKYKVYIIDEVHMLTTQAFNALLKTLEEPPEHAIFILATTEAHKLPETIVSRTQRHIFRPVETAKVIAHLKALAKEEKIDIDDEALALFAAQGGGSFRDSISLLDQAGSKGEKITKDDAEAMLGIPSATATDALLSAMAAADHAEALGQLEHLQASGYHAAAVAKQLGSRLRASYVSGKLLFAPTVQLQLMRDLLDVAPAHDPAKVLELSILKAMPVTGTVAAAPTAPASQPQKTAALANPKPVKPAETAPKVEPTRKTAVAPAPAAAEEANDEPTAPTSSETLDPAIWNSVLEALKSKYNTLYGVMRMAVPEFSEGTMTLRFRFAFHQKRMNEVKHRKIVGDIVKELTGHNIMIVCLHDKDAVLSDSPISAGNAAPAATDPALTAISNIFGGGELIES